MKRSSPTQARLRTRSFACADDDWQEVEAFAHRRGLGSTSDAARLLLRTGLHTEQLVDEFAAAQAWQIAQAWADAQAIANGDREVGSWDTIREAAEKARARIRERMAARQDAAER